MPSPEMFHRSPSRKILAPARAPNPAPQDKTSAPLHDRADAAKSLPPAATSTPVAANAFERLSLTRRGEFNYLGLNCILYSRLGEFYFRVRPAERRLYEAVGIRAFKNWYLRVSANFYTAYRLYGHRLGGIPDLRTKMVYLEAFTRVDEALQAFALGMFAKLSYQTFAVGSWKLGALLAAAAAACVPFTLLQRYNRAKTQRYLDSAESHCHRSSTARNATGE
jgi:hypothetical protein